MQNNVIIPEKQKFSESDRGINSHENHLHKTRQQTDISFVLNKCRKLLFLVSFYGLSLYPGQALFCLFTVLVNADETSNCMV